VPRVVSHVGMGLIDDVRAGMLPTPQTRRAIRLAARVSQVRMANELGVHRATLIRWENGDQEPSGDARIAYAQLLKDLREVSN
jgi:DNA-binding XRE family transcriptional regulator